MADERDPTRLGPVAEERLRRTWELARALPEASRAEVAAVQAHLEHLPQPAAAGSAGAGHAALHAALDEEVAALREAVEDLRAEVALVRALLEAQRRAA